MITITIPKTREDFKAYYELRYKVLRAPWGQPKDTEKDDYEPISQHFMAIDDENGKIVGVIKMFEKTEGVGWVSHLAIDPGYQKKGVDNASGFGVLQISCSHTGGRYRQRISKNVIFRKSSFITFRRIFGRYPC